MSFWVSDQAQVKREVDMVMFSGRIAHYIKVPALFWLFILIFISHIFKQNLFSGGYSKMGTFSESPHHTSTASFFGQKFKFSRIRLKVHKSPSKSIKSP